MNDGVFVHVRISPWPDWVKDRLFDLWVKTMIFTWEPIWLVFSVVLITAIFVAVAHFLVDVFASKKNPAAVEDNIDMKLLLSSVLFYTSPVDTHNITDASDLWAVFDSLSVENTVHKLVAFAGFITKRIMWLVDYLNRANILVVGCFVWKGGVHHNAIYVDLVLVYLKLLQRRVDHLKALESHFDLPFCGCFHRRDVPFVRLIAVLRGTEK